MTILPLNQPINIRFTPSQSLQAGLDLELTCCGAPAVFPTLNVSVRQGRVPESAVDRALRRTLPVRFELGWYLRVSQDMVVWV